MPNRRELGYVSAGSTSTIVATSGYGVATGGTSTSITVSSQAYTLLTFTASGTLTVTSAGLFDILLIAGGGAGAGYSTGGGGGGGDVVGIDDVISIYLSANTTITVGAGGTGFSSALNLTTSFGGKTTIGSIVAVGGGCGGAMSTRSSDYRPNRVPGGGSSGGGSACEVVAKGVGKNGFNGGIGTGLIDDAGTAANNSGGGGGAGGVGGNGSGTTGGTGGHGLDISAWITGSTYYAGAGAGGGGTVTGGTAGNGGVAGKTTGAGNAGVNYGAGGGGTNSTTLSGGSGQNGVAYIRFKV